MFVFDHWNDPSLFMSFKPIQHMSAIHRFDASKLSLADNMMAKSVPNSFLQYDWPFNQSFGSEIYINLLDNTGALSSIVLWLYL